MRKIMMILAIAIVSTLGASAKSSKMSLGVDYNYSSKGGGSGLGVQLEYEIFKNVRLAPELIYTFAHDGHTHYTNVNFNVQYVVPTMAGFNLYPLAGLAYVNGDNDLNNCGVNLGCGFEYSFSKDFSIYTEQTFQLVSDATRFIPAFGIKYSF